MPNMGFFKLVRAPRMLFWYNYIVSVAFNVSDVWVFAESSYRVTIGFTAVPPTKKIPAITPISK